ncbi:response regulator [Phenylobacterium montanum]|uniref:Response regulator n=2 Tax=Phenylobacterium montanum TaxID=2823693 RepID=A0A975G6D4_9CAUL|nr:response regulator [Caulobacter sp. S6]
MEHNLALQGLRLMVVEDEPMAALEIQDMLGAFGCQIVGVASNLHKGLAIACNEGLALDGAVLDINLGGEQVYPVAERLKARGVPFIFSTGYGRAGQAPSFAHIPTLNKPYGPEDLEEMLVQVFVSSLKRRGFSVR